MDANKEFEFVCSGSLSAIALSIAAFFGSGDCPNKAKNRYRTKSIVEATTEPGRKAQSPPS
jgi:hypothetical protein